MRDVFVGHLERCATLVVERLAKFLGALPGR